MSSNIVTTGYKNIPAPINADELVTEVCDFDVDGLKYRARLISVKNGILCFEDKYGIRKEFLAKEIQNIKSLREVRMEACSKIDAAGKTNNVAAICYEFAGFLGTPVKILIKGRDEESLEGVLSDYNAHVVTLEKPNGRKQVIRVSVINSIEQTALPVYKETIRRR